MNKEQIKQLALANGFKLKEQANGTLDLNPYVYEFTKALIVDVVADCIMRIDSIPVLCHDNPAMRYSDTVEDRTASNFKNDAVKKLLDYANRIKEGEV